MLVQDNKLPDLLDPIIALGIFVAGYLLNQLQHVLESRKKLRNLKTILFRELAANYKQLNQVVPKIQEERQAPQIIAQASAYLSTVVYDQYLNRLDTLPTRYLDPVYEAYSSLHALPVNLKSYVDNPSSSFAGLVDYGARTAHKRIEEALLQFEGGTNLIRTLEPERGKITMKSFA